MKRISALLGIFLCGLVVESMLFAQDHPKPMTNNDVVAMAKAGLPDDTILNAIGAQETNFDNSAAALVDLTKQGVSVKVIDAIISASKKQVSSPAGAASTAPGSSTSSSEHGAQSGPTTPGASAGQKFAGQPASGPQNSAGQPQGGSNTNTSSQGNSRGFFGRLNQVQGQVNGAVQQTQGTVQQGQATVRQAEGTGTANPGANTATPGAQAKPSAKATAAQPKTAPTTAAVPSTTTADQAPAPQAQQATVADQQRQQQIAARQKLTDQMTACRKQATSIDPQMRTPDAQKAYTSCVQAAVQSSIQTK